MRTSAWTGILFAKTLQVFNVQGDVHRFITCETVAAEAGLMAEGSNRVATVTQ